MGVYVDNYLITETCSVEGGGGGGGWKIVDLYPELSYFLLLKIYLRTYGTDLTRTNFSLTDIFVLFSEGCRRSECLRPGQAERAGEVQAERAQESQHVRLQHQVRLPEGERALVLS